MEDHRIFQKIQQDVELTPGGKPIIIQECHKGKTITKLFVPEVKKKKRPD